MINLSAVDRSLCCWMLRLISLLSIDLSAVTLLSINLSLVASIDQFNSCCSAVDRSLCCRLISLVSIYYLLLLLIEQLLSIDLTLAGCCCCCCNCCCCRSIPLLLIDLSADHNNKSTLRMSFALISLMFCCLLFTSLP
jgi:hypothetical protein